MLQWEQTISVDFPENAPLVLLVSTLDSSFAVLQFDNYSVIFWNMDENESVETEQQCQQFEISGLK